MSSPCQALRCMACKRPSPLWRAGSDSGRAKEYRSTGQTGVCICDTLCPHPAKYVQGEHGSTSALLAGGKCNQQAGCVLLGLGGGCAQQREGGREDIAAQHEHVRLQAVCQAMQCVSCRLLAHGRLRLPQIQDQARNRPRPASVSLILRKVCMRKLCVSSEVVYAQPMRAKLVSISCTIWPRNHLVSNVLHGAFQNQEHREQAIVHGQSEMRAWLACRATRCRACSVHKIHGEAVVMKLGQGIISKIIPAICLEVFEVDSSGRLLVMPVTFEIDMLVCVCAHT